MFDKIIPPNGVRVTVISLGADEAYWLLDHMPVNRHARKKAIKTYSEKMLTDKWFVSTLSLAGRLGDKRAQFLDGQNRMRALLLANDIQPGIHLPFVLLEGLQPEDQDHIDTGRARTIADQLVRRGESNPTTLGATLRTLYRFDKGDLKGKSTDPQHDDLLDYLDANPTVREAVEVGLRVRRARRYGPPSVYAAAYHVLSRIEPDDATAFIDGLASLANLPEGSPIISLDDRLRATFLGPRGSRSSTGATSYYLLGLIFRSWNHWRAGDDGVRIVFRPGGAKPEPFPMPE